VVGGRLGEAEQYARRGYDLATKVYGEGDYRTVTPEEILATVLVAEDRMDEALLLQRRVNAARASAVGADSPDLIVSDLNEAEDLDLMGHADDALSLYRFVFAKWDPGPYANYAHTIVATALRHLGRYTEALAEDRAALEPPTKAPLADPRPREHTGLGLDELLLGHPREAVPWLEQAVAESFDDEDYAEEALFGLAQALWDSGGDKARAREMASKAREKVRDRAEKFGGRFAKQMDRADAWLDRHR
jgi:tetratricopeptide (TPR) repeat protein